MPSLHQQLVLVLCFYQVFYNNLRLCRALSGYIFILTKGTDKINVAITRGAEMIS